MFRDRLTRILTHWLPAPLAGALLLAIGLLVFTGYLTGVTWMKSAGLGNLEMMLNTAFIINIAGAALLLLQSQKRSIRIIVSLLAAFIILEGLINLLKFFLNLDFIANLRIRTRILDLFFGKEVSTDMSVTSALSFIFGGYIILSLALDREYRLRYLTHVLNASVFAIAIISLIGYLVGLYDIIGATKYRNMSVFTSIAFVLLSLGLTSQIQKNIRTTITSSQLIIWATTLISACIIFITLISSVVLNLQKNSDLEVEHIRKVEKILLELKFRVQESDFYLHEYVSTRNPAYFSEHIVAEKEIKRVFMGITFLETGNEEHLKRIKNLGTLLAVRSEIIDSITVTEIPGNNNAAKIKTLYNKEKELSEATAIQIEKIIDLEDGTLAQHQKEFNRYFARSQDLMHLAVGFQVFLFVIILLIVNSDIIGRRKALYQLNSLNQELENIVKKRTESLEKNERRFRSTMDNMMEGCQILDFELRYRYINDTAARQGKLNKAAYYGKRIVDLYPGVEGTRLYTNLQRCLNDKERIEFENDFHYPDGTHGIFLARMEPVEEGVFILTSDITEQKKAASELERYKNHLEEQVEKRTIELEQAVERISDLYENAPCGYHSLDNKGIILLMNNTELEWLGYTRDEVVGKIVYRDLLTSESQTIFDKRFPEFIKNGEINDVELEVRRKDGGTFFISVSGKAIYDKEGKLMMSRSSLFDITSRKKAEQAFQEAVIQAEEANKAKSMFLANMSHEIRTPMNAMLGYTELLSKNINDKVMNGYLESIRSSGKSLLNLINDILDLSKIEEGKTELSYKYILTKNFFEEFEKIFALRLAEKGLNFNLVLSPGTPEAIFIDDGKLRQVILNLLGNALKFTLKGEISLVIKGINHRQKDYEYKHQDDLVDLEIEIRDTGVGIPKNKLEKIFESFFQVKETSHLGGTGLGLNISAKLINLMNGSLSVSSTLKKGSTFRIHIPDVLYKTHFATSQLKPRYIPEQIEFSPARIVVIDDVALNRRFITDALKDTPIQVLEEENGNSALATIKKVRPDLVIADIRMEGMNGYKLLERIKKDKTIQSIPVLAYSASVMKEQRERIMNSAFAGLLIKPLEVQDLFEHLMEHLPYSVHVQSKKHKQRSINRNEPVPEELKAVLSGELNDRWKTFRTRQPLDEIAGFALALRNLGSEFKIEELIDYGNSLLDATNLLDIEMIMKELNAYPELIRRL